MLINKVFIIAEAGINHNGDVKTAKKLIYLAKQAGADAIKFQLFNTKYFINQKKLLKTYKRFKNLELKMSEWQILKNYAKKLKIIFFFSIFDEKSLNLNKKLKLRLVKIPSGEINNIKLLKEINKSKANVIASTGMSSLKEIKNAVRILKNCKISLLHCLSEYPAKIENLNLNFINVLKKVSRVSKVGFSDHSDSIILPSTAVSMGARIIEKHFTHNRRLRLGDHKISLDYKNFKKMCENIRITSLALGQEKKITTKSEKKLSLLARKGLYSIKDLKKGSRIKTSDIAYLRPTNTFKAIKNEKKVLGKITKKNIFAYKEFFKNDIK